MGMFNNNLAIDKEEPFKYDRLQRKAEAENLISVFDIVDNQMVLAVNSKWGTGKTSFLKMWNQYLINNNYKTIFFNAWENDYVEEPFIAFVDEIRESIKDEEAIKGFMEKAKDAGLALAKQSPKIVSKIVENKTGFKSEEIISNNELTKIISNKIDNYNKNKKSVNKFKEELESLASKELEKNEKPIVIFVDELDRCRPDFAIRLLERIKHFFNVQNIIFVLGIDKEALSNSIRVVYGEQTDINGYLSRFIDLEYKLRENNDDRYVEYLMDKYNFSEIFESRRFHDTLLVEYQYSDFSKLMVQVMINFKLSLRDIEKVIVEIYMILKANIRNYIYPYQLIMLCVIKHIDRNIYNKIKFKQISYNDLLLRLKQQNNNIQAWFEDRKTCAFKAYILWLLGDSNEIGELKSNVSGLSKNERSANKYVKCLEYYNRIVNYQIVPGDEIEIRKIIFKMVELYDNFTMINGK